MQVVRIWFCSCLCLILVLRFYTVVFLIEFSIQILFKIFFLPSQNAWLSYCVLGLYFFSRKDILSIFGKQNKISIQEPSVVAVETLLLSTEPPGGKNQATLIGEGYWMSRSAPRDPVLLLLSSTRKSLSSFCFVFYNQNLILTLLITSVLETWIRKRIF